MFYNIFRVIWYFSGGISVDFSLKMVDFRLIFHVKNLQHFGKQRKNLFKMRLEIAKHEVEADPLYPVDAIARPVPTGNVIFCEKIAGYPTVF